MDSPQGMIIAYATQAGRTADDGTGRNSPYTSAFLKRIEEEEEIGTIFRRISADVYQATNQKQLPELSLSLIGEFYLRGRPPPAAATGSETRPTSIDPCSAAERHWNSAEAIGSKAALEDHLSRYPNCAFAGLARARIAALTPSFQPQPSSGSERPQAGGLLTDSDMRRVKAIATAHQFVLPQFKIEQPSDALSYSLRQFIGIWASEIATAGGRGRHFMLIVEDVDTEGAAIGRWVYGMDPFRSEPAGNGQILGRIANGQLTFEIGRAKDILVTARFGANNRLFLQWERDGSPISITLNPVWRLVEAERMAKPTGSSPTAAPSGHAVATEEPGSQGGGLLTERDLQRIKTIAEKKDLPPPPEFTLLGSDSMAPAATRKFIGIWVSETGFGGLGRHAMLIVTSVDAQSRARGHYLWGPPTPRSPYKFPRGSYNFSGRISGDQLVFPGPWWEVTASLAGQDRLHFEQRRQDGGIVSVVLVPAWRLIDAERTTEGASQSRSGLIDTPRASPPKAATQRSLQARSRAQANCRLETLQQCVARVCPTGGCGLRGSGVCTPAKRKTVCN
jgi:hypothetical protein